MAVKVLHIIGCMDAGGVESWLMNVIRNSEKSKTEHILCYQKNKKSFFDQELIDNDIKIYICELKNLFRYILNLCKLLKELRPDVVHSHVYTFSALIMVVAFFMGIKVRISHAHSDRRFIEKNNNFLKKIYIKIAKRVISLFSTHCLAVSIKAKESLFPSYNTKGQIIFCGVDLDRFRKISNNSNEIRKKNGIPEDSIVLGHVGRFVEAKNHKFLIDVFDQLYRDNPNYFLVLVGDGELKDFYKKYIYNLNCKSNIMFLGLRSDVDIIFNNIFDIFLFPSLWEGLPITLIEAQSTGIPCLMSDIITNEICFSSSFKLELDLDLWVSSILKTPIERKYDEELFVSDFNIHNSLIKLNKIYFNLDGI